MSAAQLETRADAGATTLLFAGPLTARGVAPIWSRAMADAAKAPSDLTLDVSQAEMIDTSGAALLLAIERAQASPITWSGLTEAQTSLLAQLRAALPQGAPVKPPPPPGRGGHAPGPRMEGWFKKKYRAPPPFQV
jgi:phospholipid/cholesterol/gamma-HCH transport system permease protein